MREVPEGGWKSLTCRGFFLTVGSKVIIKVLIAHTSGDLAAKLCKDGVYGTASVKKKQTKIKRYTNTADI